MKVIIKLFLIALTLVFVLPAYAAEKSKPLKGKDLETAQAMNDIYARHMLSSSCLERQKTYFIPYGISGQEKEARIASYKKNCECLTDTVLKSYSANDAIDFITQTQGAVEPVKSQGKTIRSIPNNQQREKFAKMTYMMNVDKENRKNCGFQK